jgi:cation diffusion facilitator family transporter/RNA polymerase sigma factor (sigma-70 family)
MESARIVGALTRMLRDLGRAEELAQDALLEALERWPADGVPDRPGAWLMQVAKRRALDHLRHHAMHASKEGELSWEMDNLLADGGSFRDPAELATLAQEAADIDDDVLRLIFVCCHPVLSAEARAALALKLLGGLATGEIARAFLVPEATVAQRIVRAKRTLAEARVPFEVPRGEELRPRLASVLQVIYLIYNEGYSASAGNEWLRPTLCREALRLGRVLAELMPDEGEVHGLVALMEIQSSRERARTGPDGAHDHRKASRRALAVVLALTVGFTVVEVVGGILTGSLAVLADAGHMLSDTFAIGLALVALTLARRPSTPRRSFGFQRAEILAAFVNGLTLVIVSGWIVWEAVQRFRDPPEILGGWMLLVALAGLAVTGVSALILMRSEAESLNVEAALRHVVADLLGSAGVLVAAVVILATGWTLVDPIVSIAIALLIVGSAWSVLRDSTAILMEQTPPDIDAAAVAQAIVSVPGVTSVHDLHVWRITSGFDALSAHVLVGRGEDCHGLRREIERRLESEFEITHTTLQVDHHASEALIELRRTATTRPG